MRSPSNSITRSPCLSPALSAGLSRRTSSITAPACGCWRLPSDVSMSWTVTPICEPGPPQNIRKGSWERSGVATTKDPNTIASAVRTLRMPRRFMTPPLLLQSDEGARAKVGKRSHVLHRTAHGGASVQSCPCQEPGHAQGIHRRRRKSFRRVENETVKFMRLQFTDILGTIKNVEIPDRQFEEALNGQ